MKHRLTESAGLLTWCVAVAMATFVVAQGGCGRATNDGEGLVIDLANLRWH